MKRSLLAFAFSLVAMGALVQGCSESSQPAGPAASNVAFERTTSRSVDEWVDAQGTFCFDLGGGCIKFVPPVENFLGWTEAQTNRAASFDYAGVANRWIEEETDGAMSMGTEVRGTVTERVLDDGRALISVNIHTSNALAWACDGFNFAGGDLLFGHRPPDVVNGAEPALGDVHFQVEFTMAAPGLPLPDLLQVLAFPTAGQEVRSMKINANATGELHPEFGAGEDRNGRLNVVQNGIFNTGFNGAVGDGYPVENVDIRATGN